MKPRKALLIVDVQNDFCPGGALAVPEGDRIIPVLNRYIRLFSKRNLPIFISRDWHPKITRHFRAGGGIWPEHCVQNTKGAKFHPKLKIPGNANIISKGTDPDKDGYSSFWAEDANGNLFPNILKTMGIREIFIGGIATNYCIKESTLDALKAGFKVRILADAIKGIDLKKGDSDRAVKQMLRHGARKVKISKCATI